MFYGVHDDDLCDLLSSRLDDGDDGGDGEHLCPQRWLGQQPGDGETSIPPEVAGSAAR